ncbi:MAG: hypothetical protein PHT54_02995, partial [Candidatus Nanoarchaeia archaeon]|nr:hypothetical protein [Candidatus Nanoarchaeia archaeon]
NLIKRFKPSKVFIPSFGDFHPTKDHQAVAMITTDVLKKMDYNGEIYTYELWLLKKENLPYIYVDVSKYQKRKIDLVKSFHSQKHFTYPLLIIYLLKSRLYGRKIKAKYAERFYKLQ